MKHARPIQAILMATALSFLCAVAVNAESIFLRDGKILQGKVAAENDKTITLTLKDGTRKTVPRTDVLRMLYSDEYLTKSLIHLTSGEQFEGFMVDETRDSYTIRKKLIDTKEQVIPKDQIANIEKIRPSKLAGQNTDRGIDLTWSKPIGAFKMFIVYMKKKGGEYKAVDNVKKSRLLIAKCEADTAYQFAVKMVDNDNYESPLSNEITVKTLKKGEKAPKYQEVLPEEKESVVSEKEDKSSSISVGIYGTGGIYRQDWSRKYDNISNAGGGIVLDSAVAKNKLINYRFTLGAEENFGFRYVTKPMLYKFLGFYSGTWYPLILTDYYKAKDPINPVSLTMSTAVGFGVLRTELVRLWLGPEFIVSFMMSTPEKLIGGAGGIGLVLGININFGELVTLSLSGSARALYAVQNSKYSRPSVLTVDPSIMLVPFNPISKVKILEHGLRFGGQMNLAVIFRINDRYSGSAK